MNQNKLSRPPVFDESGFGLGVTLRPPAQEAPGQPLEVVFSELTIRQTLASRALDGKVRTFPRVEKVSPPTDLFRFRTRCKGGSI